MIPRTKVNYHISDLWHAFWVSEHNNAYKQDLIHQLQGYLSEENILLTPSGRAGLYFLLKAMPASCVIMPAYTCKAVAEACLIAGKKIVYVELEDSGFNMDLDSLEPFLHDDAIVIATHQFGIPCKIKEIVDLSHAHGAIVVEDVAAALGTCIEGKKVGTFGDAAFYSFDSTKLINVPLKGGFLTVKDEVLLRQIESLYKREIQPMPQSHKLNLLTKGLILNLLENGFLYQAFHMIYFQWRNKFTADDPVLMPKKTAFYEYDFTNWQSYIALKQLIGLDTIICQHQHLYKIYLEGLANCEAFTLPPKDERSEWACIRFPICVTGDKISYYQKAIRKGVDFAFSFTFIPCSDDNFHRSNQVAKAILDLPFYLKLKPSEIQKVIDTLHQLDVEFKLAKPD